MKVEVNKETLQKTVSTANKTVSLNPTTPVLSNLLVKTARGGIEVTSTNLDATIRVWAAAKVVAPGETTIPARIFGELLATLTQGKVELTYEKETLLLSTGKVRAKIPTISAKEFPTPPQAKKNGGAQVDKKEFAESVALVARSASQDEGRPTLTGVLFRPNKKSTTMVATDGYRLAKKETNNLLNEEVIIPARDLVEAVKIFSEVEDEKINISSSEGDNQVTFSASHIEYSTKLVAGEFPTYEQIIPKEFVSRVVLHKETFMESLKIVSTFAKDLGNVVRMTFKESGSFLSASSAQVGESRVGITPKIDGQSLEIAFNTRYLQDGISSVKEDKIEMHFAGPGSPALVKSIEDDSFIYVVMTVRTQT
jgi:DNA polymerase-3 subunit beta